MIFRCCRSVLCSNKRRLSQLKIPILFTSIETFISRASIIYVHNYNITVTQVNMFYWMYAWSTMYLSSVPVHIAWHTLCVYMHACVHCINLMFCFKYQWPWCPAYWPRCPLIILKSQSQLALPSNCPNVRPATRIPSA